MIVKVPPKDLLTNIDSLNMKQGTSACWLKAAWCIVTHIRAPSPG
jgi:hypothetical protein